MTITRAKAAGTRYLPIPALAFWLVAGCSRSPVTLPPLPAVSASEFALGLRPQLDQSLEEARREPSNPAAAGRLGMFLQAHDRNEAALQCYERARFLDPSSFSWHYYTAFAQKTLGNLEAAVNSATQACRIRPDYVPAKLLLAGLRIEQGKLDEAASLLDAVLKSHPGSAGAWYGLGRARAAMPDHTRAVEALDRAVQLFPEYGPAHYSMAQSLRSLNRASEAASHSALAQRHSSRFPDSGDTVLAEVLRLNQSGAELIRQGSQLESEGRLAEAAAMHRRALESDPRSALAHTNLISLYGRLGDDTQAEAAFRAAIGIDPDMADAHYNYGVLLFRQKKTAAARQAFEHALRTNPQHAEAHNNLGYLLEMSGQADEARKHYQLATVHQPNHRLAHFHLARGLTARRQYAEAIGHLEKTIAPEDENTPGFLYALGLAHGRAGDRAKAAAIFARAHGSATARGQKDLVAAIENDMRLLGALR